MATEVVLAYEVGQNRLIHRRRVELSGETIIPRPRGTRVSPSASVSASRFTARRSTF